MPERAEPHDPYGPDSITAYYIASERNKQDQVLRLEKLERLVKYTVSQKFDDVCWLDVYQKLGKLVGVDYKPELIPEAEFLHNCQAFHQSLKTGCKYVAPAVKIDDPDKLREALRCAINLAEHYDGDSTVRANLAALTAFLDSLPPTPVVVTDHDGQ